MRRTISRITGALVALSAVGLFALSSCSDTPTAPRQDTILPPMPLFDFTRASNGSGACLLKDAQDAGYINNLTSLNCTSNDVDISYADITQYRIGSKIGTYTSLNTGAGERISCIPGDHIFAITLAYIQNSAQERYDFGLWINNGVAPDTSAYDGSSCLHFNLIPGQNGSTSLDLTPDACGDIAGNGLVTVPLDTLELICPSGGATTVPVGACASWANGTTGSNDRVCPVPTAPTTAQGFRWGTTPGTTAKCRCEPLVLPIDVKGVLRIKKVTAPTGSSQSFDFTTTGTDYTTPFSLTDGQVNTSNPISAGTYTAAETVPSGWDLTNRQCVLTGTATPKSFASISNGVSVDLTAGEDVTCTFTNTQQVQLHIKKVTVPSGSAQSFSFTPSGYGSAFNLTDGQTNDSGYLTPGTYGAAETVPTGWDLTNRVCVLTGTATAKSFTPTTNGVSVALAAGENVTCTFTNTQRAQLHIKKVTDPSGDPQSFGFTPSNYGSAFSLSDGQTNDSGYLVPGTYGATETVPTGWNLSNRACVLTGTATPHAFSSPTNGVSVALAAGEDVTCTFTNTKKAVLHIKKVTVPSGDAQSFAFTTSGYGSGFSLSDGQTNDSGVLDPGTYGADETVPGGWDLTNRACVLTGTATSKTFTPTATGVSVTLGAGEDVTCTFTNTKRVHLRIKKVTVPSGSSQSFNFTPSGYGSGFSLTDGNTNDSGSLVPGTYGAAESVPSGWDLTNRACVLTGTATPHAFSSPTDGVSVALAAGEDVTCTFTNTQRGQLRIKKVTVPSGDSQPFDFTPSGYGSGFSLTNGQTNSSGLLVPGTYGAAETVPTGWDLTNRACVLTGTATAKSFTPTTNGVSVNVAAGEDVTCTFTNTKRVHLRIKKLTNPTGASQSFGFTPSGYGSSFSLTDGQTNDSGLLVPGTYGAAETVPSEWALTGRACVLTGTATPHAFSSPTNGVSVVLAAGEDVTCTFTNSRKPRLIVTKTVAGGGPMTFDFSSTAGAGFTLGDGGSNDTGYSLAPGSYTICELNQAVAWAAIVGVTGGSGNSGIYNPDSPQDLGNRCVNVTLAYTDVATVAWTNTPPPGGDARTIGYWKNWSSCASSNGNQYQKALDRGDWDKTLDGNLPQTIGLLVLDGAPATNQPAVDCADAVNILDKSDINSGKKQASDACYNLAAQLLAAQLNYTAGAGQCPAASSAIANAQALLVSVGFTGTGACLPSKGKGSSDPNFTLANSLAAILDSYNNNTLCPST